MCTLHLDQFYGQSPTLRRKIILQKYSRNCVHGISPGYPPPSSHFTFYRAFENDALQIFLSPFIKHMLFCFYPFFNMAHVVKFLVIPISKLGGRNISMNSLTKKIEESWTRTETPQLKLHKQAGKEATVWVFLVNGLKLQQCLFWNTLKQEGIWLCKKLCIYYNRLNQQIIWFQWLKK